MTLAPQLSPGGRLLLKADLPAGVQRLRIDSPARLTLVTATGRVRESRPEPHQLHQLKAGGQAVGRLPGR